MAKAFAESNKRSDGALSVESRLLQASTLAGGREYQDVSFKPALEALVDSLNHESKLSSLGFSHHEDQFHRIIGELLNGHRYKESPFKL